VKAVTLGALASILALSLLLVTCGPRRVKIDSRHSAQAPDSAGSAFAAQHAAMGFPLLGRHAELPCGACHGERQPKPSCESCHTSPHGSGFKQTCEDCHTAGLPFSSVKFRHADKGLFGFHENVACVKCHQGNSFRKADRNCTACHADFHKGALGRDCYECHRSAPWAVTAFNHNTTGFPLMGAHRALECGDCHRDLQSFRIVPRPTGCASCHENDYRSSRFEHAAYGAGTDCQECHALDTWTYAHSPAWFNILTGPHAGIACGTCHGNVQNYREYTCHACHARHSDDNGGRCLDCHPGGFPRGGENGD
jgi:hypothetical protein